jgi:muramoyltetrapeptide carboxypeptidase LdcA involved in peptidoglycan recycling
MPTIPSKLKAGDTVCIVAPSHSLSMIAHDLREIATKRLADLGLIVTFSEHAEEQDELISSSIESRVADLHAAFADLSVKAIMTVIGGFNCNQLLPYLDWDLIRKNPKIFIGYSDTTALQHAMLAKADLVTYSGPAYSTFGQKLYFDYTHDYFKKCLFGVELFAVMPSPSWTDDAWYLNQEKRHPIPNEGYWILSEGKAEGTVIGGNLCTLNLLQGTEYFPNVQGTILFLEDDEESDYKHLDRDFESLLQAIPIENIRGIVFGRFQNKSSMTRQLMERLTRIRPKLKNIPIVANADFGHTSPMVTFPIGGRARIAAQQGKGEIVIVEH